MQTVENWFYIHVAVIRQSFIENVQKGGRFAKLMLQQAYLSRGVYRRLGRPVDACWSISDMLRKSIQTQASRHGGRRLRGATYTDSRTCTACMAAHHHICAFYWRQFSLWRSRNHMLHRTYARQASHARGLRRCDLSRRDGGVDMSVLAPFEARLTIREGIRSSGRLPASGFGRLKKKKVLGRREGT